jgi:hypothetical protein
MVVHADIIKGQVKYINATAMDQHIKQMAICFNVLIY